MMTQDMLFKLGLSLVFVGFITICIAVLLLFLKGIRGEGRVKGGGVVMIGPIPIVFGTDKESVKTLLLLSMALIALFLILTTFSHYGLG